jgi:hypothetical protein
MAPREETQGLLPHGGSSPSGGGATTTTDDDAPIITYSFSAFGKACSNHDFGKTTNGGGSGDDGDGGGGRSGGGGSGGGGEGSGNGGGGRGLSAYCPFALPLTCLLAAATVLLVGFPGVMPHSNPANHEVVTRTNRHSWYLDEVGPDGDCSPRHRHALKTLLSSVVESNGSVG